PAATTLLVMLGGNAAAVAAQRDAVASLGRATEIPSAIWETLRAVEPPGSAVLRLGGRPSGFAAAWQTMRDASAILPGALVHGSPARGAVRAVFPDPAAVPVEETLRALA